MAYENIDLVKNPYKTAQVDAYMRAYNNFGNQVHQIPKVGINNRFCYSPKTIFLQNQNEIRGLLDKGPIIPYTFDQFAMYDSLRDYQKGMAVSYKKFGENTQLSGKPADFNVVFFHESPPYTRDYFVNGARGCDLNDHVNSALKYVEGVESGQMRRSNFFSPIYYLTSNWKWESDPNGTETGINCGAVNILKKINWQGSAFERNGQIEYELSGSYDPHYIPATIDALFDAGSIENVSYSDFHMPPLSNAVQEFAWNPRTPPSDGILDFKVEFTPTRQSTNTTEIIIDIDMPLQVAFSNTTNLSMDVIIPCHPYNFYYDKRNNGQCRNSSRNPLNRTTDDESIAVGWTESRKATNVFYNFNTGLDCMDVYEGDTTFNVFRIPPLATMMFSIDVDRIFKRDGNTAQSFHLWNQGYKYVNGEYIADTSNPYNGGCYGFWIDLHECFFRLAVPTFA